MATDARIRELDARHEKLDHQITQEMKRPSADPLRITNLKKQKLKLKEEIESLRVRQ